MTEHL